MECDTAGSEDCRVDQFQLQFLLQAHAVQQAPAFAYKDGVNDKTKLVHQAKGDQLRGKINTAGQHRFACFLFQSQDFVARIAVNNSRICVISLV